MLGRHVGGGAHDEAGFGGAQGERGGVGGGLRLRDSGFGQAEVEDLDVAGGGEFDVGGFQVAVDDALFVGSIEGFGDLPGDLDGGVGVELADLVFERRALHQLHDDGVAFQAVDLGNARMVERGQDAGFAFEAGHEIGVKGERFGEHFDGDVAAEFGVVGAVDFAHAAFAEKAEDGVRAEALAGV